MNEKIPIAKLLTLVGQELEARASNSNKKVLEMLVLTRKRNEEIEIGEHIKIYVCQLNGCKVKLGIEAPADLVIRRGELPRLMEQERENF